MLFTFRLLELLRRHWLRRSARSCRWLRLGDRRVGPPDRPTVEGQRGRDHERVEDEELHGGHVTNRIVGHVPLPARSLVRPGYHTSRKRRGRLR